MLVLENYDAHDIADEFGISPKTAKSYIRKVCRKVGSTDVEGLVDVLDAWDAERENEAESTR